MVDSQVGARFGSYKLIKELGRGGMGVVYEAVDEQLNRAAAIKILPRSAAGDADARSRFLREARAAAGIHHPNVATVYAVDEDNGQLYIAMELVRGTNLRAKLGSGRPSLQEVFEIAEQVAAALEKAHLAGIVHRDLKPENIMIADGGTVKLLDFGIAKLMHPTGSSNASDATTLPGQVLGTPGYASPEQISGRTTDARADVFSFGVVCYEIASGQCPFARPSLGEQLAAVIRDSVPPLSTLVPQIPKAIDEFLARCLAKDPTARYGDGAALRSAIRELRRVVVGFSGQQDRTPLADQSAVAFASTVLPLASTVDPSASTESAGKAAPAALGTAVVNESAESNVDSRAKSKTVPSADPFIRDRVAVAKARALAHVRAHVDAAIRSTASDERFPPLALQRDEGGERVTLRALFERTPGYRLSGTLMAIFSCAAPGGENGVALVNCCAAILGAEVEGGELVAPEEFFRTVFHADIAEETVVAAVHRALVSLLEEAVKREPAHTRDVLWIAPTEV